MYVCLVIKWLLGILCLQIRITDKWFLRDGYISFLYADSVGSVSEAFGNLLMEQDAVLQCRKCVAL